VFVSAALYISLHWHALFFMVSGCDVNNNIILRSVPFNDVEGGEEPLTQALSANSNSTESKLSSCTVTNYKDAGFCEPKNPGFLLIG